MHITKATAKRFIINRRWLITTPLLLQLAPQVLVQRRVLSASCPCPVPRQRSRGFVPLWALWIRLGMYLVKSKMRRYNNNEFQPTTIRLEEAPLRAPQRPHFGRLRARLEVLTVYLSRLSG
ncbi:uncharacterized protein EDB93DRAFT_429112 [Suillus bovinus]|uniref:uncharacterized protein n=1 Tax=Suillus bovinus TaxID=48563 RepID=UPI001B86D58A|nr:uncharacterized protein EDB93DRAFT_429112 [Suillus bovinus]KAG2158877.1 hypothetical protein EDB93DRAFT_429112 [Suillus bovinus]